MTKQFLLLASGLLMLLLASCGKQPASKACTLNGHVAPNYDMAYLTSVDRTRLDSVPLKGGDFHLRLADSVATPYAVILRLVDFEDSLNQMDMPLIVERGDIRLDIGEYIRISGTPLNDAIQHFYNAMQACVDQVKARTDIKPEEIRHIFSDFYKQQILLNKDNALGRYILQDYGYNLLPADREETEKQLAIDN